MNDLLHQLEAARQGVRGGRTGEELDKLLSNLTEQTRQVLNEHEGMADELLGLYEQLGAVFEITRKLTLVQEEQQVVELLRVTVAEAFARYTVGLAWPAAEPSGPPLWTWWGPCDPETCDVLGERLARVHATKDVRVEHLAGSDNPDDPAQLLGAPVYCNGELVCTLALIRREQDPEFRASDMSLLEVLTTFCGDLVANIRLHHQLRQISVDLVRSLVSTIDQKDPYTSGHSMRVGYYSKRLGERIGLRGEELQMLEWSALLHDVGKIGIRDDVLKKPGKLTDEEFNHIKEHPVRSYEVVRRVPQLALALDGIRHHHERYDGRGYPDGLAGENIPLQARIIQVADIFDALTSSRSYRGAFDWTKALSIIEEEAGTVVDPALARIFACMIRDDFEGKPDAWNAMTQYGVAEDVFARQAAPKACGSAAEGGLRS